MPNKYKTPGVYIDEISRMPKSIAEVETSIPAFIGSTEIFVHSPMRISSMAEFQTHFGGAFLENAVYQANSALAIIEKDTEPVQILCKPNKSAISGRYLYVQLKMFFSNGGSDCYIISTGDFGSQIEDTALLESLNKTALIDEITLLVFTDRHQNWSTNISGYQSIYTAALMQCAALGDRMNIQDVWCISAEPLKDTENFRNETGNSNLEYGCVYYPWINAQIEYPVDENILKIAHIVNGKFGDFNGKTIAELKALDNTKYSELKAKMASECMSLPPSASIAGIMARVDRERGVWKAPANVAIFEILGPTISIKNSIQDTINIDESGRGIYINTIRYFTGKGTLVWGARTLAGSDNEWRYISVRRYINMVKESVSKSLSFVVFEPNDANTWFKVKSMVENFLFDQWRKGACQGAKPEDAYFVKVGLGVTMTPQDILNGKLKVEIGIAAIRPAEFIIFTLAFNLQL